MRAISLLAGVLPGLSTSQLGAAVILAAFALAGFAIYAMLAMAKELKK